MYKVADVARTNGDLHFVYTADFTGCGIALGDLTDSTLASRLEAMLPRAAGTTHKISEQGIVSFDALPLGLYLVVQTENSKGYEAINSFLVSLPMADESGWALHRGRHPQGGRAHAGGDPARTGNSQQAFGTGQQNRPSRRSPSEPDKPTQPGTPDEPDNPDMPVDPNDPNRPVSPGNPDNPVNPGNPDNPVAPGNPDSPVAPGRPDGNALPRAAS